MRYRKEQDSMGSIHVPEAMYYGAQTQRALTHFKVSDLSFHPSLIRALGLIKRCAAQVNMELGLLSDDVAGAIVTASDEVIAGQHDPQFVVDVFQTGSGTSTNMNANEVIAGRANEILTGKRGGKSPVHPNDHVNLGQSSNDVIPSAIHIAALCGIRQELIPPMDGLQQSLAIMSNRFAKIRKIARTHLQDAVPMALGDEFSAYERQVELSRERIVKTETAMLELALGGTAVGTGLNTHPNFASKVITLISSETGYPFFEARNHFEAQAAQDGAVAISGALKTYAVSLIKMANDIRWLSSGPRCGLGEISIPALQPGSSIMPGKVNPVIPEAVLQVAAQVIGNDVTITFAGQAGNFELNTMAPVIAYNLLQSIYILGAVTHIFKKDCVEGIEANQEKCLSNIEQSLAICTALVPAIGYDRAADLAKAAFAKGKTIREVALEMNILPHDEVNQILDDVVKGRG